MSESFVKGSCFDEREGKNIKAATVEKVLKKFAEVKITTVSKICSLYNSTYFLIVYYCEWTLIELRIFVSNISATCFSNGCVCRRNRCDRE